METEELAKMIHEGNYNPNIPSGRIEWDKLDDKTRDERRNSARYLLKNFVIYKRKPKEKPGIT